MTKRTSLFTWLAITACSLSIPAAANAKTIYVDDDGPPDFNNIQAAIDDSNDGDTILVADGLYVGEDHWHDALVDFNGKAITLQSKNGPTNCTLSGDGGGYVVHFSSGETDTSVLSGFTITEAPWNGAILCFDSSPTIMNNIITGNGTDNGEGGITLYNSSAIIVGNIIARNDISGECCGISCEGDSSPIIANNTIVRNGYQGAWGRPGIISRFGATPTIVNCIIWDSGTEYDLEDCSATYSCIEHEHPGLGNIYADPMFVDPDNGDYHLLPGSPCIDAGCNPAVPDFLAADLDGIARIANGMVDIGAYETGERDILLNTIAIRVPEGATATFTIALARDPLGAIPVTLEKYLGDPDITIESDTILTFDSSDYSEPKTAVLGAAEDGDYVSSLSVFWISAPGFQTAGIRATEQENDVSPAILRVDADAPGIGSGRSWTDAFRDLQEALRNAQEFAEIVKEIWVAQGVYLPAGPSGDRQATFQLIEGVSIKGGYAGFGEPNPDARDIARYETILSGDLNEDDAEVTTLANLWEEQSRAENSYHVVTASETNNSGVLDGFTITAGNANWGDRLDCDGGGMCCKNEASPTVINCTFRHNSAQYTGGGMLNRGEGSGPRVINCIFTANSARLSGGGFYNRWDASRPHLTNCTFAGNLGGGMSTDDRAYATLLNCILWGNKSHSGQPRQLSGNNLAVDYSCIEGSTGGLDGEGNTGADPCFVDAAREDYHLKSRAGRWDPNNETWLIDNVTSPCIDAGDPMSRIGYEPFPNGGIINMGAYGGTAQASKSYFGKPHCETIVAGDVNGDCEINFSDFRLMTLHWLEEH